MKDKKGCKERLIEKLEGEHTKKAERKIADYFLKNFEKTLHSTLLELAEEIGVSDASIVRFCKSIGYVGFQEYKINAALESVPAPRLYNSGLTAQDSPSEICSKIFSIENSALQQTSVEMNVEVVEQAAADMLSARRIMIAGTGGSSIVAKDLQHKLLKIGVFSMVNEDKDLQLMTASLLGKGDVLLAISASGSNRHMARVVEIQHGNGARVITLTTKAKNLLEEQADLSLYTVSEKTIFESESFSVRLAQLAVLDCLVAIMAFRNYDRSLEAMSATRLSTSSDKE